MLNLPCCRRELRAVKAGRVVIVDGSQMFARPGPRLVDALEFLVGLLHDKPDIIPKDFPWQYWPTGSPQDHALPSTAPSTEDQNTGSRPKGKSASIAGVTSTAAETNADRIELSSMTESVKQGSVGAGMSGEGETRGSTDSVRMPNGLMSGGEGLDHTAGQQPANKSNGMLTRGFPSQSQEVTVQGKCEVVLLHSADCQLRRIAATYLDWRT